MRKQDSTTTTKLSRCMYIESNISAPLRYLRLPVVFFFFQVCLLTHETRVVGPVYNSESSRSLNKCNLSIHHSHCLPSMSASDPPRRMPVSYNYYFNKVLTKRLRYVNKINVLLAILLSVLIQLPYGGFWWSLVATLYRAPVIYLSLWLIKCSRKLNSTVEYSRAKTLAEQIVRSVATRQYLITFGFYLASSCSIFTLFIFQLPLRHQFSVISKEYRRKPAINDEYVFFWFHAFFIALIYSIQHVVFQRNRLNFKYGVNSVKPESVLFANIAGLLGNAIVFNIFTSVVSPFVYFSARSTVYKANWLVFKILSVDSSIPRFHISFGTLVNVSFISFFVYCAWEFVNHVYAIYSTIGCLDGSKTISSYSPDPVETLLSGLRDLAPEQQLSRLSAFQELAYLASTTDAQGVKIRNSIFNSHSKGGFIWTAILDECSLVIKDVTSRINYRSKADMDALKAVLDSLKAAEAPLGFQVDKEDKLIFGNSVECAGNGKPNAFDISATSSPLKKYDNPTSKKKSLPVLSVLSKFFLQQNADNVVVSFLRSQFSALVNPESSAYPSIRLKINLLSKTLNTYHEKFLASSVGVFFRVTVKRDAESRVLDPVNYGNAVIALAGLPSHAIEENRKNTITDNHISEVFNLLERPIRACSNYTDILPASVYRPHNVLVDEQPKQHLIALLHDLTMNEFFLLCYKYNYKLNDLLLSSRAFKLAKWVVDASIAQQQKQGQSHASKLF